MIILAARSAENDDHSRTPLASGFDNSAAEDHRRCNLSSENIVASIYVLRLVEDLQRLERAAQT